LSCYLLFPASKPKSGRNSTYPRCSDFPSHLFTEAVVFATLNIGAALLFAIFCVRDLIHRSWLMKLFDLLGLAAYIVVALSVNLALAQYARELIVGCKAFIHHTPRNPKFVVRRVTDR
jgi:hypothetical protein